MHTYTGIDGRTYTIYDNHVIHEKIYDADEMARLVENADKGNNLIATAPGLTEFYPLFKRGENEQETAETKMGQIKPEDEEGARWEALPGGGLSKNTQSSE